MRQTTLVFALVLTPALACADPPAEDADTVPADAGQAAEAVGAAADANASPAARSPGTTGTVTLNGETYEFEVQRCTVEGDVDPERERTLNGRGTTPDGQVFHVYVTRMEVSNMRSHSVSVQFGDVREGEVWEAGRTKSTDESQPSDGWMDPLEGYDGDEPPLIRISGNEISVEGKFMNDAAGEEVVEGSLQATCG